MEAERVRMKFKTLRMKNFMRYKGINEINFSCDETHNVTVILGITL